MTAELHALFHKGEHGLARIGVGFPVIEGDFGHPGPLLFLYVLHTKTGEDQVKRDLAAR